MWHVGRANGLTKYKAEGKINILEQLTIIISLQRMFNPQTLGAWAPTKYSLWIDLSICIACILVSLV